MWETGRLDLLGQQQKSKAEASTVGTSHINCHLIELARHCQVTESEEVKAMVKVK